MKIIKKIFKYLVYILYPLIAIFHIYFMRKEISGYLYQPPFSSQLIYILVPILLPLIIYFFIYVIKKIRKKNFDKSKVFLISSSIYIILFFIFQFGWSIDLLKEQKQIWSYGNEQSVNINDYQKMIVGDWYLKTGGSDNLFLQYHFNKNGVLDASKGSLPQYDDFNCGSTWSIKGNTLILIKKIDNLECDKYKGPLHLPMTDKHLEYKIEHFSKNKMILNFKGKTGSYWKKEFSVYY